MFGRMPLLTVIPNVACFVAVTILSFFQGLSLLPLMEPSITASLDLFAPFGSSPADGKAQLKGSFGNAVLDNIPDYYSQLLTKVLSVKQADVYSIDLLWLSRFPAAYCS